MLLDIGVLSIWGILLNKRAMNIIVQILHRHTFLFLLYRHLQSLLHCTGATVNILKSDSFPRCLRHCKAAAVNVCPRFYNMCTRVCSHSFYLNLSENICYKTLLILPISHLFTFLSGKSVQIFAQFLIGLSSCY